MRVLESKISTDFDYTDSFIRNMDNSTINVGVTQKYFQKANYKQAYNELKVELSELDAEIKLLSQNTSKNTIAIANTIPIHFIVLCASSPKN